MNQSINSMFLFALALFSLIVIEIIRRYWRLTVLISIIVPGTLSRLLAALLPSVFMETTHYIGVKGEKIPMRIYHPKKSGRRPVFIIYPGASPTGEEHEALNILGEGMAKLGLRVFLPRLSALKDVLIQSETTEEILKAYRQVGQRSDVNPKKIAVVGVSFSGSLVIKAFAEESITTMPACILSYGSYFDIENTLRFALTGDFSDGNDQYHIDPNEWGRIVFFHNHLDLLEEHLNPERVRPYFLKLVQNDENGAEDAFKKMSEQEQEFVRKIVDGNRKETMELAEEILPKLKDVNIALSPRYFINKINFPLFLMHGSQDNMVPFTETVKFSRILRSEGKNVKTYISHLYGHSKVDVYKKGIKFLVKELWNMGLFMNKVLNTVFK